MAGDQRGNVEPVAIASVLSAHLRNAPRGANRRMADQIGVSPATFSRWLDGSVIPDERQAAAIARAVGSDEGSILASIAVARHLRYQAQEAARMAEVRDDRYRMIEETIERITQEIRALRADVDELRSGSGPGGDRGARRRSR